MIDLAEANLFAWTVVLVQLLRIERRMGAGDEVLKRLKKHCRLFNGNGRRKGGGDGEMGKDRGAEKREAQGVSEDASA